MKIFYPFSKRILVSYVLLLFASDSMSQQIMVGNFSVSPAGGAIYSIPITMPAMTGGVAPKLALEYNSQAGNGLLGVGWQLSGLSEITRCSQYQAVDGASAVVGVNYSNTDKYCLDGQRLLVSGGAAYGANGAEYRAEEGGFEKIVSYVENGATDGPGSFVVKTKSGFVMEFGNLGVSSSSADARIFAAGKTAVASWALNKVSDAKGNFYTISYSRDNELGQHYPLAISNQNSNVNFSYEVRSDKLNGYHAGAQSNIQMR